MADPTQADRIEAAVSGLASDFAATRATLQTILTREITMANTQDTNQQILQAALDAINTTTSQEATLLSQATAQLQADGGKMDAIQTLITSILSTTGVPQSVLDQAAAIQQALGAVATSTSAIISTNTALAARLDQLAVDPRNPVPVPPPVAQPVA